jgi:hypothetical protein
VVLDEGRRWRGRLERLGRWCGVPVRVTAGTAAYVGGESRGLARRAYRELIAAYENAPARRTYRPAARCEPVPCCLGLAKGP